jgi:Tol biopolymer transport system component
LETGNDVVDPYWASAGAGLIFVRDLWDTNLWRAPVQDASGQQSPPAKLVASTREESSVDVSPDGTRIAFASARTGGFELWVADVDGSRAQQLTDFKGPETGYPRWSPDSRRIAFNSYPEGRPAIYVVLAGGGERPRRLADGEMPFWSLDGEQVCFVQRATGVMRLMCAPASGGTPSIITEAPGAMARLTSDGSHLIVERHEALWLRSVSETGPGQVIVRPVAHGNWATLGDEVCYLRYAATSVAVECLNLLSRRTTSLASVAAWPRVYGPPAFAIAPDRTWVIYGRTDQLESNIMRAVLSPER